MREVRELDVRFTGVEEGKIKIRVRFAAGRNNLEQVRHRVISVYTDAVQEFSEDSE